MEKAIDLSQNKHLSDELSCGENKNAHVNNPFLSILNDFQDVDSNLINFKILSLIKILSVLHYYCSPTLFAKPIGKVYGFLF